MSRVSPGTMKMGRTRNQKGFLPANHANCANRDRRFPSHSRHSRD